MTTTNPEAALEAARKVTVRRGGFGRGRPREDAVTIDRAAELHGISARSISRARALLHHSDPDLIQSVSEGEISGQTYGQIAAAWR